MVLVGQKYIVDKSHQNQKYYKTIWKKGFIE